MNRLEKEFYKRVKTYFPTAKKVELNDGPTLLVFFKVGSNEFDIDETKVLRMLKIYSMVGEGIFDQFLVDIEELYTIFSLPGEAHNLDFSFLFV